MENSKIQDHGPVARNLTGTARLNSQHQAGRLNRLSNPAPHLSGRHGAAHYTILDLPQGGYYRNWPDSGWAGSVG